MYTVTDLVEIGAAEDLIFATKMVEVEDDSAFPSDLPSEQFDE